MLRSLLASAAVAALAAGGTAGLAVAQQPAEPQQAEQQEQVVAEQCLQDLRAQAQLMHEEGYWLTGWGHRWTGLPEVAPGEPSGVGVAEPRAPLTEPGVPPAGPGMGAPAAGPWDTVGTRPAFGIMAPSYQIRTLHEAANVLAHRGDEQACQAVLAQLEVVYDDYATQLREAGVEPGQVTTWRQEQMAAAQPVTEVQALTVMTVDHIIGTDVRNLQDEHLGTVDDVVLDPETGEISFVILAYGGFLGIGDDHVAVPWQDFQATPGLAVLVLDVSQEALEQAPRVDPDRFAQPDVFTQWRQDIEAWWQDVRG